VWLPVVAWMGLIFYLSAQPDLPQPRMGWMDLLISSAGHAFMFGVLALLWARVLGQRRHALLIAWAVTMVYALSDELHQVFVPGRHADPWDLVCDGLGATLGLLALAWWRGR
jgi:VanZ family protein